MKVIFPNLKRLHVLQATRDCDLTAYELLVYSYLNKKSHHRESSTSKMMSGATGISEETIPKITQRLTDKGYIKDGALVPKPEFFNQDTSKTGTFWERSYFWQFYVPRLGSDSPMTVNMSLIWSYMMHKTRIDNFVPPKGWSPSYVASILRMSYATADKAIVKLQDLGFLVDTGASYGMKKNLTIEQEGYFQQHGETIGGAGFVGKTIELID